jgi:hypothetical protein
MQTQRNGKRNARGTQRKGNATCSRKGNATCSRGISVWQVVPVTADPHGPIGAAARTAVAVAEFEFRCGTTSHQPRMMDLRGRTDAAARITTVELEFRSGLWRDVPPTADPRGPLDAAARIGDRSRGTRIPMRQDVSSTAGDGSARPHRSLRPRASQSWNVGLAERSREPRNRDNPTVNSH